MPKLRTGLVVVFGLLLFSNCALPTSPLVGQINGFKDGVLQNAQFNKPQDMTLDPDGNLIVADTGNFAIRKVTPEGRVTTIAGTGKPGVKNGDAKQAQFYDPTGIVVNSKGHIFVKDGDCIRELYPDKNYEVSTFIGTCNPDFESPEDRDEREITPEFISFPSERNGSLAIDHNDNLILASTKLVFITHDKKVQPIFDLNTREIHSTIQVKLAYTNNDILYVIRDLGWPTSSYFSAYTKEGSTIKITKNPVFSGLFPNYNSSERVVTLTRDAFGDLYVLNGGEIYKVFSTGQTFALGYVNLEFRAVDMEVDAKNKVIYFLSDTTHKIVKWKI